MHSLKIVSMAFLLACALTACCAFTGQVAQTDEPLESGSARDDQSKTTGSDASAAAAPAGKKSDAAQPKAGTVLKGKAAQPAAGAAPRNGKYSRAGSDNASAQGSGGMISLNFDNADIFEVINALSDFLGINYIIDPAVKGKVNIHTTSEVDRRQLLSILETIFEMNNISVVKQGDFYKILPSKDAQKEGVEVGVGRDIEKPDSLDRMTIQIMPLKYVPTAEVVKVIKPFSSKNGEMVEFTKSNIIILFDTAANIQKIVKLVNIIDSDLFEQNEVRFFKVKNASVTDLAKELEGIFTSIGIDKATGKGIGLAIVPVERAGMLVAVSPIPNVLDQVQHWVEVLDTIDKDANEQVFIYFVQNGRAEDIGDILNQIYGGGTASGGGGRSDRKSNRGGSRSSGSSGGSGGSGSSMSSRTSSSSRNSSNSSSAARNNSGTTGNRSRTGGAGGGAAGGAGGASNLLDRDIQIVTDDTTNAIIVRANSQDYAKIRETIQRLDIIPRQVLIEVLIAEVKLTGDMQFGVEWSLLQNNDKLGGYKGSSISGLTSFGGLNQALTATGAAQTGFTYLFQSERLQAFLLAHENRDKVNTLSAPNILIADNQQAHIEVGSEIPIATGSQSTINNTTGIYNSIEYRNTGVILDVTPRINDKGLVAMDISQEVSEVGLPFDVGGTQSSSFETKKAETSVVVQNGQTVVIGGIIKDKNDKNSDSVPFLSKVPILNYLFGYTKSHKEKDELIIMLTPHVVNNSGEAAALTEEYKEKMEDIHKFLKRSDDKYLKSYK